MFLFLIACSATQNASSVTLNRQAHMPLEDGGLGYEVLVDTRAGCRTSDWLSSTLENVRATFGSASSSGGLCQQVGVSWANTDRLDLREQVVLSLNDWSSSYPIVLGNWPTAQRALVPDIPIAADTLAGSSVGFDLEGPGVLDPDLQVVVYTFDGTWLLPQDGGAVTVNEDHVLVDFPSGITSAVELVFEQAWPATVVEGDERLRLDVAFSPNDAGQSFVLDWD
jgi:hypothetical protein